MGRGPPARPISGRSDFSFFKMLLHFFVSHLIASANFGTFVFSHNITVVGLLNSLAQALCPHCWISSFQPPSGKRPIIIVVGVFFLVGPLWLDPSPLPFKGEISLPNTILTTQRYFLVGPLVWFFWLDPFGWTPRLSLLKAKFHSLTRFLLHNDICGFLVGPLAFAFKRPFSPSLTPRRGSMTFFLFLPL